MKCSGLCSHMCRREGNSCVWHASHAVPPLSFHMQLVWCFTAKVIRVNEALSVRERANDKVRVRIGLWTQGNTRAELIVLVTFQTVSSHVSHVSFHGTEDVRCCTCIMLCSAFARLCLSSAFCYDAEQRGACAA